MPRKGITCSETLTRRLFRTTTPLLLGFLLGLLFAWFFLISTSRDDQAIGKPDQQNMAVYRSTLKYVRIMCIVVTTEKYHQPRAELVKATWGAKCDGLVFASDAEDRKLGAIRIHDNSSYYEIWAKVKRAFQWAHDNYLEDFDWFLKADDDTFVIMENLKLFLSTIDPELPVYTGRHFNDPTKKVKKGYAPGGAGYAISRTGLRRLVKQGYQSEKCPKALVSTLGQHYEDINMGACLEAAGVGIVDCRDPRNHEQLFHPVQPGRHILPFASLAKELKFYDVHGFKAGWECCSSAAVSFHYIKERDLLGMNYLIYKFKTFSPENMFEQSPLDVARRLCDNHYLRCGVFENSSQRVINAFKVAEVSQKIANTNI